MGGEGKSCKSVLVRSPLCAPRTHLGLLRSVSCGLPGRSIYPLAPGLHELRVAPGSVNSQIVLVRAPTVSTGLGVSGEALGKDILEVGAVSVR